MKYSIVIPTHERAVLCQRLIESIEKAKPRDFEIIVVLDNCTQQYGLKSKLPLKIIKNTTSPGGGRARNLGAKYAKGEYLIYFDDDVVLLQTFFRDVERIVKRYKPMVLSGTVLPIDKKTTSLLYSYLQSIMRKYKFFTTTNLILHRSIIRSTGFREEPFIQPTPDYAFFLHLPPQKIHFSHKPFVYHQSMSAAGFLRRLFLYASKYRQTKKIMNLQADDLKHTLVELGPGFSYHDAFKRLNLLRKGYIFLFVIIGSLIFFTINIGQRNKLNLLKQILGQLNRSDRSEVTIAR